MELKTIDNETVKEMHVCRSCLSELVGYSLHRTDVLVRSGLHFCKRCHRRKHIVYKIKHQED